MTIGVVSGKQLIWSKSYGAADMEKQTPASEDTVYEMGSVTKMFTALMLAQLADDGKVHLSDPVEKYFPEVNSVQRRFPDEPGTQRSYSNVGYAILGAALSRAAGIPYVEFVRKRIFEPLGMAHSAFEPNPQMLPKLSKGDEVQGVRVDSETAQRKHAGRGYGVPRGAMYTTVGDLARFASFLLGKGPESVLKTASLDRNLRQQPVQSNVDLTTGYGRGFPVVRRERYTAFGHGGNIVGYGAALFMNREVRGVSAAIATPLGRIPPSPTNIGVGRAASAWAWAQFENSIVIGPTSRFTSAATVR
jgi:CubicO group peptidase (beta-lactamase class C family)